MKLLLFLSNTIIPLLIFYIVGTGLLQKQNIYEEFIHGAEDGFRTVIKIMPTLIGLMVAVGILRASGLLDAVSSVFSHMISSKIIPSEIIPVFVIRLFQILQLPVWRWTYLKIRYRFHAWLYQFYYDELYRNGILYNVCLFYVCKY